MSQNDNTVRRTTERSAQGSTARSPYRKPMTTTSRSQGPFEETTANRPPTPGPVQKFLRTPKGLVLLMLLGLMVVGAIHASDRAGIVNIFAAMLTASAIDVLVGAARKNRRLFPDGGMITGLIIGLVLSGSVQWPVAALTAAIAVVAKHLLKIGRKPIFNPAAFALLFTLLVFHTGQSWWGDLADLPVLFLPLLFVAGGFVTSRVNKWPQVLTYLGTYFLILTLAASLHMGNASFTPGDAMRVPLVNAALFMSFFMLTDPPTSPGKYSEQVTFSVVAAVVSAAIYLVVGGLSYLLIGLLVANGWQAVAAVRTKRAKQAEQATASRVAGQRAQNPKVKRESFG